MRSRLTNICAGVIVALIAASPAPAQDADFYRGKTLIIGVHTGPGGGYDTYARVLSRHIGRHIPGNPNAIVLNQPGAGGLLGFNYAGITAPRDGTYIALVAQGVMTHEPIGRPGLRVSLADFNWLGNLARSTFITVMWPGSAIRTLDDARKREVLTPSTGITGTDSQLPAAYNALLGTRFKVVQGYDSGGQMNLAADRGEMDGRGAWNWANLKAVYPDDVKGGRFHVLIQTGLRKEPELPDVPLLADLVANDPAKAAVARFLSTAVALNRTLAAPPGVPAPRLAILRKAFDETIVDPLFLAEAEKTGSEIIPMTGEETREAVAGILATPRDVVEGVKDALGATLQ